MVIYMKYYTLAYFVLPFFIFLYHNIFFYFLYNDTSRTFIIHFLFSSCLFRNLKIFFKKISFMSRISMDFNVLLLFNIISWATVKRFFFIFIFLSGLLFFLLFFIEIIKKIQIVLQLLTILIHGIL